MALPLKQLTIAVIALSLGLSGLAWKVAEGSLDLPFDLPSWVSVLSDDSLSLNEIKEIARQVTVRVQVGEQSASGTIVFARKDANATTYYVLTNRHVTDVAAEYRLVTVDGETHVATLMNGVDARYDLALLEFRSANPYAVATTGYLETLPPEEKTVVAAGFVTGSDDITIERGALEFIPDRALTGGYRLGYSAAVQQGMSGGPVLDNQGQLIGINGMGMNPVLSSAYDFADGTPPDAATIARMRSLSWGVPLAALTDAAPDLLQVLKPVNAPNGAVLGSVALSGKIGAVNAEAEQVTVRLEVASAVKGAQGAQGSGVIIARKGQNYYVLTAEHVVRSSNEQPRRYCERGCRVVMPDGRSFDRKAKHVTLIPGADLAVVRVNSTQEYPVATLSDQRVANDRDPGFLVVSGFLGETRMISGGFPQSFGLTDSKGGDISRALSTGQELVYTAASYHGFSGGPIFDLGGRVVGIHSASDVQTGDVAIILGHSLGVPLRERRSLLTAAGVPAAALHWKREPLPPLITTEDVLAIVRSGLFTLKQPPADGDFAAWMNYGSQLWRIGGRHDDAIAAFQRAIDLDPQSHLAYYGLGLALQGDGQQSKAAQAFEQATVKKDNFIEAWRDWGLVLREADLLTEAIAKLTAAIERDVNLNPGESRNFGLFFYRGATYSKLGKYDAAVADYDKALALNPDLAYAYNNRGFAYSNLGKYDAALADYGKALALNPDDAEAYYNRGVTYSNLGKYDAALADYGKALALNPDDAEAYNNRGVTYDKLGKYDVALMDYGKAITLNPDLAEVYYNRGVTYSNLRKYDAALMDYDKALALNPDFAGVYYNRGTTYVQLEKYDAALADYGKALALNPNFAEVYYNRGMIYGNLGQYDAALADFKKAETLLCAQGHPACPQVRKNIKLLQTSR
jgi:tetratricopeptide (TPR) repeat protein/S1-C subfamily serine protease